MSIVIESLKKAYFELCMKENFPDTPDITKKLDLLEVAIKEEIEKEKV